MASSSPKPNLLISFAKDQEEASIAREMGKALNEAVITYQDLATGRVSLPSTQTRLSFYGHGNTEVFGSDREHFTPTQFAEVIMRILTVNPGIRDIDLLSCDVGLINDKGESYVSHVQAILANAGYNININTFLVDNHNNDVKESLFVVGVDNSYNQSVRQTLLLKGVDLVKKDEFSLDVVRSSNEQMMKVSAELEDVREKLGWEEAVSGMFSAMKVCCNNYTYTEAALKSEMRKQFSESTVNRLLEMYHFEYNNKEGYFKCDVPPAQIRATYAGKYNAVRNAKYSFEGEVREAQNLTPNDTGALNDRLLAVSCEYTELRAREGRVIKDKLSNIRRYLQPAPRLEGTLTSSPVVSSPSTSGIHSVLTAAAMGTPTVSKSTVAESMKPDPASRVTAPPPSVTPSSPSVQQSSEETQKKSEDHKKENKPPEPPEPPALRASRHRTSSKA